MDLITRAQWGARPSTQPLGRIPGPVRSVTFHYEGPHLGDFPHEHCYSLVRGIQNYHMDSNGWIDIAYNALVCYHGYTFEGRWLGAQSAAQGSNEGNWTSYAICGMWGDTDPLTDKAKHAYLETRAYFMANGAGDGIFPHQHWFNTSCPGAPVVDWIAAGCPDPLLEVVVPSSSFTDKAVAVDFPATGGVVTFAADGGVFCEGGAKFFGSLGGIRLAADIVWGGCTDSGLGYWMVGADGGIFNFGDAYNYGVKAYAPLAAEYASGQRHITSARRHGNGLTLVSNKGERYDLGV